MKRRLSPVVFFAAAALTVLSCTVIDRLLGRGLTAPQAQARATEARKSVV